MLYENLEVYKKAVFINSLIYRFLKSNDCLPNYLKNQLGRASLSIMLNIAEGSAKFSSRDRRNFFIISRGSVFECYSLLSFLANENEIPIELQNQICSVLQEISKILFAMIRNLNTK